MLMHVLFPKISKLKYLKYLMIMKIRESQNVIARLYDSVPLVYGSAKSALCKDFK